MTIAHVLLIGLCNMFAVRASKVLVSLFALELGASVFAIGMLVAAYSVIPLLFALYAGKLADRLGMRLPMIFGSAGMACGLLVPFLAPSLAGLFVSAVLIGGSHVFYHVSAQNMVGTLSPMTDRTKHFSNFALFVAMGSFLGPLAAGFGIDAVGHARAYLLIAASPLVPLAIIFAKAGNWPRPGTAPGAGGRGSSADLWRIPELRRVLIAGGAVLTGFDLYDFYMPIYARSTGLSASAIGVVVSMYALASFAVRSMLPVLARRTNEETLLVYAMFLGAIGYVALPFFSNPWTLGAISFALGLGLGCGQPLSMTLTFSRSPASRSGEALGLRLTVNNITHVSVPLLFGGLGSMLGVAPVFWINAAILAASGWWARSASRR